jgi:hypothetical protein
MGELVRVVGLGGLHLGWFGKWSNSGSQDPIRLPSPSLTRAYLQPTLRVTIPPMSKRIPPIILHLPPPTRQFLKILLRIPSNPPIRRSKNSILRPSPRKRNISARTPRNTRKMVWRTSFISIMVVGCSC